MSSSLGFSISRSPETTPIPPPRANSNNNGFNNGGIFSIPPPSEFNFRSPLSASPLTLSRGPSPPITVNESNNNLKSSEIRGKTAKLEAEIRTLRSERDQALEDLKNVETAFSDLHKKYERAKNTLENLKKNEDRLIERDSALVAKIEQREAHLKMLKDEVTQTLERMYLDHQAKAQSTEAENMRLRAQIQKTEIKVTTLESDLEQKTKENMKLHNLCDELINNGPQN